MNIRQIKLPSIQSNKTKFILSTLLFSIGLIGIFAIMLIAKNSRLQLNSGSTTLGGDKDVHGCIGSAGYTWCENKQKCLREWEEPCELEDIFSFMGTIRQATGIEFSAINPAKFEWMIDNGSIEIEGKIFKARHVPMEQASKVMAFFETNGFKTDVFNIAAGTRVSSTGYNKDNTYCIVISTVTGEYQDLEISCGIF